MHEWEILLRLANIAAGQGAAADPHARDDARATGMVDKAVRRRASNVAGRDPEELLSRLAPRRGPERILDLMLRTGPFGDGFGADPGGLSLDVLDDHPHGVDLGPLTPRIPEVLRTPSGSIELAPDPIVAGVGRPRTALERLRSAGLMLIRRRDLRSNNSWMHNVEGLVKGRDRCTMLVPPDDAAQLGLRDGGSAQVT